MPSEWSVDDIEWLSSLLPKEDQAPAEPYKILRWRWLTTPMGVIGIVAIETRQGTQEWKAYIGVGLGINQKADEQQIAAMGASLEPQEAHGFFPSLDIERYKKE